MTRRTALQFVGAMFAATNGERIMTDHQTTGPALKFAHLKPTSLRLHLDSDVKLEIDIDGEIVEIPKDELIAALRPTR